MHPNKNKTAFDRQFFDSIVTWSKILTEKKLIDIKTHHTIQKNIKIKRKVIISMLLDSWIYCSFSHTDLLYITAKKMKFSIKNSFSKCDQVHSFLRILFTFNEEVLNGKLHFLCSASLKDEKTRHLLNRAYIIAIVYYNFMTGPERRSICSPCALSLPPENIRRP